MRNHLWNSRMADGKITKKGTTNMMPKEKFRAGRAFVRTIRTLANIVLALLSVAGAGWAIYVMVSAIYDLSNQSSERERLEQRIAAIPAERDQALAALLPQQEQEANRLHDTIKKADATWQAAMRKLNDCLIKTAKTVQSGVPDVQINCQPLTVTGITTVEGAQQAGSVVTQAQQRVNEYKAALFSDIEQDLQALTQPVLDEKQKILSQIAELEQQIASLMAEIEAIKAKYMQTREVITTYWQRDSMLKDHEVYSLKQGESDVSQHARDLSTIGYMLPVHSSRLCANSHLLNAERLKSLNKHTSRLSGWLPIVVIGGKVEEHSEEKIPLEPLMLRLVLSNEDSQRIMNLEAQIYSNQNSIKELQRAVKDCDTELANLERVSKDMQSSKSVVLKGWTIDGHLQQVADIPATAVQAFNELESLNITYENKKAEIISRYEQESTAAANRIPQSWHEDCAAAQKTILTQLGFAPAPLAAGWLLWLILMIWMDFAAATLIAALRAQEAHEILNGRKG